MPNPLFNRFNQNARPMNGMMGMMQRFQQFKNSFQGDPRAQVQQLLDSGQMSQEQFNQLSQMASQFQSMIGR